METKVCSNPNCIHQCEPQPIINFYKDSRTEDGLQSRCKDCFRKYFQDHREDRKKYRNKNKDKINARKREIYQENSEKIKQQLKKSAEKRRDKIKIYKTNYDNQPAKVKVSFDKLKKYYQINENIRIDPKNPELIQVRCFNSTCKNWFNPTTSQVNNRIYSIEHSGYGESNLYCCDECKKTCLVYNYRTNIDNIQNKISNCSYTNILQKELRNLVFELDKNTCQWCGKNINDYPELVLHCHHIISPKIEPILSSDVNNCITFCDDCHYYFHSLPECTMKEIAQKVREKILMESRMR